MIIGISMSHRSTRNRSFWGLMELCIALIRSKRALASIATTASRGICLKCWPACSVGFGRKCLICAWHDLQPSKIHHHVECQFEFLAFCPEAQLANSLWFMMIHDFASSSSCKSLPSAEAAQNFQRRAVGEVCKETATKLTRDPQIFMWPAGWSHPGAHCWYVTASTWKTMDSWRFLGAAFFSRDKNLWVSRNPKEFLSDSDGRGCCWRLHLMMCLWPSELPRWFMQSSDPRRCFQCLVYNGPACPSKVWLGWFASPFLQDVFAWHGGQQRIWPTLMEQDSDRWKPATLSKGIVPGPQVDGRQSWWRKLQLWNP